MLSEQWRRESGTSSLMIEMVTCPSYQAIIGMGQKAVPMILAQLQSEGDRPQMWFWALRAITGIDPVPAEARGNFAQMARACLEWGRGQYVY